jgi:lysophospholipase L1-like esterase
MKTALLTIFLLSLTSLTFAQDPARFQEEIDAIQEREYLVNARKETVVFTGSSSVRMWTNVQEYYTEVNAINTGFGGSEFSDLIHYRDELIFAFNPDRVFIYEGDNDVNSRKDTETILNDAKELISYIKKELPGIPVYLISPKPSIARWGLQEEYEQTNQALKEYASDTEDVAYIDVWNPMLNESGEPKSDIFIEDDLHMNEKGYDIWGEVIRPYLED